MALPIPSKLVLSFAGYFIFNGRMTFPEALGVSTAVSLLGSLAIYFFRVKNRDIPISHFDDRVASIEGGNYRKVDLTLDSARIEKITKPFDGSLLGLGGGIIIVPLLTLVFGVPPLFAIGASIVSVIATSSGSASTYVKDKITNLRIGMFLEIATTTGAVTGAALTLALSKANLENVIYIAFGIVLLFSALPLLKQIGEELPPPNIRPDAISIRLKLNGEYYDKTMKTEVQYQATRSPLALAIMYLAGVISGLLGIGSGVLKVIAMDVGMRLPMKVSSTTSNFMIGVTAAASTGIFYLGGYINPFIASPVVIGVVLGSPIGTRILMRSSNKSIRKLFIPILVILAIEMLIHGL